MTDRTPSSQPPSAGPADDPAVEDPGREDAASEKLLTELLSRADEAPELRPAARARMAERLQQAAGAPAEEQPAAGTGSLRMMVVALWSRRRGISTAASALALAAAAALVFTWMQHTSEHVYENKGVGPLAVVLEDGSTAILDEGAELVGTSRRELRLRRGRVLLDVAKADQPLVVVSRHGRAIALGTRVLIADQGDATQAAVVRGQVRLEGPAGSELLRAGEQGVVKSGEAPARSQARRLSYLTSWAREAMVRRADLLDEPIRRGTLLARAPGWDREWPLPMRELKVDVHVEDGVVRTTIDQTFFNRVNRRLEGRYTFPLPPDAAVARLAMYVEGDLVEGGIVERQRGREIYESIVYLRRDPALLEWMAGNTFRVRIFPLEPRQEKRIILSYTQPLERLYDTYRLAVPIPELDEPVDEVSYAVRVAGGGYEITPHSHAVDIREDGADTVASFRAEGHLIGDDLVLSLRERKPAATQIVRHVDGSSQYLLARVQPELGEAAVPAQARRWVVLVDTSASRTPLQLRAQSYVLERLAAEADEEDRFAALAFDTSVRRWQAGWLAARDVDGVTVRGFAESEATEPLGDTDFEAALQSALEWLKQDEAASTEQGEVAAQPTIVYLGDGIATGGQRKIEALRKLLSNEATFVGIAVGEQADASLLRSLADATGGLFAQWDTADELGWQVFDLVSGLRTPRLLALSARLEGAGSPAFDDAQIYLASRQLAGGEAATVLARWQQDGAPDTLVLEGTLGGAAWTQRLSLPKSTKAGRYLPRLWARRHIAALQQLDLDAHREEITELGMKHFLVTPFTSLLVLETEAMYRRFKVSRPSDDRWAPYRAPEKIAVKSEPVGTEPLALGAEGQALILRTPVPIVQPPADPTGGSPELDDISSLRSLGVIGAGTGNQAFGRVRMGFSGLGLSGMGRGGGGVGRGFGSGHGRLGRSGKSAGSSPRQARFVTTATLRGKNSSADWKSSVGPRRAAGPMKPSLAAPAAAASAAAVDEPFNARALDGLTDDRSTGFTAPLHTDAHGVVATGKLDLSIAHLGNSAGRLGVLDPRVQRWTVALRTNGDPRLDDLSEFVSALFGDALDVDRDTMLAEAADGARGSVAPDARELLQQAAARQGAMRIRLVPAASAHSAEAMVLETQPDGRFVLERVTPTRLTERIVFTSGELSTFYPELMLVVRRPIAPCDPALLARMAPMVLPALTGLDRSYDVTRSDERTVRFAPIGKAAEGAGSVETVEIDLDSELRVSAVRRGRAGSQPQQVTLKWQGDSLAELQLGTKRYRVETEPAGKSAFDAALPGGWVQVDMPLREASHWQAQADSLSPQSEPWRRAQHQLLGTYAALGDDQQLRSVLLGLSELTEPLRRGELALASRAVGRFGDEEAVEALIGALPDEDPVAAYVRAAARQRGDVGRKRAFEALAEDDPGGLVSMLASYRALLREIEDGRKKAAFERYRAFADGKGYGALRYAALYSMNNRWRWDDPAALLTLWDELADDAELGVLAQLNAAQLAMEHAHDEELKADPGARTQAAFETARQRGQYPLVLHGVQQAFLRGAGGQARWRLFWTQWRSQLLAADDPEAWLSLGQSMQWLGLQGEVGQLVAALRDKSIEQPQLAARLARMLLRLDRPARARALLEPHLPAPGDPATAHAAGLWLLTSVVAERDGKLTEAAQALERSMAVRTEALSLSTVRALHRRLFQLRVRASRTSEKNDELAAALATAARWRQLDPDNGDIDELCATLLYSEGQPAQARRHLASIIDRHPAEGSAFARVATALEAQGRLGEAIGIWRRASEVEPTDPTWLLREAQAHLALAKPQPARALLERIAAGKWQDRFDNVAREAKDIARLAGE